MQNVAVIGLHFSGSTRLYNFLRLVYTALNYNIYCKSFDSEFYLKNNSNDKSVCVLKSHFHKKYTINFFKNNNYKVLMPYRDIRDCVITGIKRGFIKRNIKNVIHSMKKEALAYQLYTKNFKGLDILKVKYENWNSLLALEILTFLNITLSKEQLNNILNELELLKKDDRLPERDCLKNNIYQYTYLSKSHITSNGESKKYLNFFTKKENEDILKEKIIFNFLKNNNYIQI